MDTEWPEVKTRLEGRLADEYASPTDRKESFSAIEQQGIQKAKPPTASGFVRPLLRKEYG